MSKKNFCKGDCDFRSHYLSQAGNGFSDIHVYRGVPFQRGRGLGRFLSRYGVPVVKFLGKHLLRAGVDVGQDVLANKNFKESIKNRGKQTSKAIFSEGLDKVSRLVDQKGSGKRKTSFKRKKIARRRNKTVKGKAKKPRVLHRRKSKKINDIFD